MKALEAFNKKKAKAEAVASLKSRKEAEANVAHEKKLF